MNIIRDLRKERGLTQKELAKCLRLHTQFISNIERGVAPLPPKHFRKAAEVLHTTTRFLVECAVYDFRRRVRAEAFGLEKKMVFVRKRRGSRKTV